MTNQSNNNYKNSLSNFNQFWAILDREKDLNNQIIEPENEIDNTDLILGKL